MSETAEPLTITVEAGSIEKGDWVEGHGIVKDVTKNGTSVIATFKEGYRGFHSQGKVRVRLEDRGELDE